MGKMFRSVTRTWNPVTGCLHSCTYCYAKIEANGRQKNLYLANENICLPIIRPYGDSGIIPPYEPYKDPFYPRFWLSRMKQTFAEGGFVFVVNMGDLFGDWVPTDWIWQILDYVGKANKTDFLFLTKNPARYLDFYFPDNAIIGITLESNKDHGVTWAGSPIIRKSEFNIHPHRRKFVSVEPILDFDPEVLLRWIANIKPELVEVGADNHGFNLPEPPESKIRVLLEGLKGICPKVVEKDGLGRLVNNG